MNSKMKAFVDKKRNNPDYYSEIKLSQITKPVTVLIGPNGSGKSMSLRHMKEGIKYTYNKFERLFQDEKNKEVAYVSYSTSRNDIVTNSGGPMGDFSPEALMNAFRSEGERMTSSFFDWCAKDLMRALKDKDRKKLYVLIDEADSGLSYDRLKQHMEQIIEVARSEWKQGFETYFVFTCNSYEMLRALESDITEVIWVPTKQPIKIKDYDSFEKLYDEFFEVYYE